MNIYMYDADLYCEACTAVIMDDLDEKKVRDTGDSGDYPQGPYDSHQQETDSPSHCGRCHVYLEESLTREGVEYVLEKARETLQKPRAERDRIMPLPGTGEDEPGFKATWGGKRHVEIVRTWAEHVQEGLRYAVEQDGDTPSARRPGRFLKLFLALTAE